MAVLRFTWFHFEFSFTSKHFGFNSQVYSSHFKEALNSFQLFSIALKLASFGSAAQMNSPSHGIFSCATRNYLWAQSGEGWSTCHHLLTLSFHSQVLYGFRLYSALKRQLFVLWLQEELCVFMLIILSSMRAETSWELNRLYLEHKHLRLKAPNYYSGIMLLSALAPWAGFGIACLSGA